MARPGKSIFDVTMMAGWAFAAVLTGLVALTMVDDTGDSANTTTVASTVGGVDSRLVTGSIEPVETVSPNVDSLVAQQNKTFDPFAKQSGENSRQLQELIAELKSLKQEVQAFHVTTQRLRDDNDRLRQRLASLELGDSSSRVRVVDLPRQDDSRSPFVSAAKTTPMIDPQSTGSIDQTAIHPQQSGGAFDPFKPSNPNMKITEQPLTMDLDVGSAHNAEPARPMLPRVKPSSVVMVTPTDLKADEKDGSEPQSQVVAPPTPAVMLPASQTEFGLDLGSFVSISDISSAWREISAQQKTLVGGLRPLTRVIQEADGNLKLHLILGPISNAAQAASVCAELNYANYSCSVSAFMGQRLALN
nr:SPOR domain-containing protein [uncultured Cohaesibacter sp.]